MSWHQCLFYGRVAECQLTNQIPTMYISSPRHQIRAELRTRNSTKLSKITFPRNYYVKNLINGQFSWIKLYSRIYIKTHRRFFSKVAYFFHKVFEVEVEFFRLFTSHSLLKYSWNNFKTCWVELLAVLFCVDQVRHEHTRAYCTTFKCQYLQECQIFHLKLETYLSDVNWMIFMKRDQ